jgi:hypothetical protein
MSDNLGTYDASLPRRPIKAKTFEQWLSSKPSRQNLSKQEAKKRYNDYLRSTAMRKAPGSNKVVKAKRSAPGEMSYATMSESTKAYAYALVDPWDCPEAPSLPDAITLPSYKYSSRCRTKMHIGTQGEGYAAVSPYTPWGKNGPGFVYTTNASWNGISPNVGVQISLGQADPYHGTSPFDHSEFVEPEGGGSVALQSRTVACGVAVRYIGPELTRSGRIVEYRQPTNTSIYNQTLSISDMLLNRETEPGPVDREWHYAVWRPAIPSDLAYTQTIETVMPSICLIIAVEGAPPGSAFEVDAIAHFEAVGVGLPSKSKSYHDPVGMAAISSALPSHQPSGTPKDNWLAFSNEIMDSAQKALSFAPQIMEGLQFVSSLL